MSHIRSAEIESRSVFFVVSVHSFFFILRLRIFFNKFARFHGAKNATTKVQYQQQEQEQNSRKQQQASKQARAFEIKSQPNC